MTDENTTTDTSNGNTGSEPVNENTNTDQSTEQNKDTTVYTKDGWDHGEPCPDCGNHVMDVIQVSGEKYKHEHGTIEHVDYNMYREDLKVMCNDCHTVLFRHPALDELNNI